MSNLQNTVWAITLPLILGIAGCSGPDPEVVHKTSSIETSEQVAITTPTSPPANTPTLEPTATVTPTPTPVPTPIPTPTTPPVPFAVDHNTLRYWDSSKKDWQDLVDLFDGWTVIASADNEYATIVETSGVEVFVINRSRLAVESPGVEATITVDDQTIDVHIWADDHGAILALDDSYKPLYAYNSIGLHWVPTEIYRVFDGQIFEFHSDTASNQIGWVASGLPPDTVSVHERQAETIIAINEEGRGLFQMVLVDGAVNWDPLPQSSVDAIYSAASFDTLWASTNGELEVHFSNSLMEYSGFMSATVDAEVMDAVYDFIVNEVPRVARVRGRLEVVNDVEILVFGKGVNFTSPLTGINGFAVNFVEFFEIRDKLDLLEVDYVMEQMTNTRPPHDFEGLLFVDEQGEITVVHRAIPMATDNFFGHYIDQRKMISDGPATTYEKLASSAGALSLLHWNTIPSKIGPILDAFGCYYTPGTWDVAACAYPIIEYVPGEDE